MKRDEAKRLESPEGFQKPTDFCGLLRFFKTKNELCSSSLLDWSKVFCVFFKESYSLTFQQPVVLLHFYIFLQIVHKNNSSNHSFNDQPEARELAVSTKSAGENWTDLLPRRHTRPHLRPCLLTRNNQCLTESQMVLNPALPSLHQLLSSPLTSLMVSSRRSTSPWRRLTLKRRPTF